MEIDLFNNISSEVFFWLDKDRLLYFIIFFYKNLNLAKCNYKIYDKELLVIICYFK